MSNNYPTPHIKAVPEDFAKTVLMPGDPLRAKFFSGGICQCRGQVFNPWSGKVPYAQSN